MYLEGCFDLLRGHLLTLAILAVNTDAEPVCAAGPGLALAHTCLSRGRPGLPLPLAGQTNLLS